MIRHLLLAALVAFVWLSIAACGSAQNDDAGATATWSELPPLPDVVGFGGPFVGVHRRALIVAGGANFPQAPPWEGGEKVWHDRVFVLPADADQWLEAGRLPAPRAYGLTISTDDGLLLIGGSDATNVFAECHWLRWNVAAGQLEVEAAPPLPRPSAFHAGGVVDGVVVVLAGKATKASDSVSDEVWTLDLNHAPADRRWSKRRAFPGVPRIKAVGAVQSDGGGRRHLFCFSGEVTHRANDGTSRLEYLVDGWRYDPVDDRWTRTADLERPVAAGSAVDIGASHVLVFSGSTGEHVERPVEDRPEFPTDVLAYHTITDTWTRFATMPSGVVTTQVVRLGDRLVISTGEVRPGVRTNRVQVMRLERSKIALGVVNAVVLIAYLGALVVMGIYFSKREKGTEDFFLAGRRIPWWAAGISIYATQLSAITYISTPAVAYASDWLVAPGMLMILIMAPVVVKAYLPFFRRLGVTTAYEYLERRFDVSVRLFGSLSFIAFQLVRMAIVVYLPALTLSTVTGLDVFVCIVLMGVLATIYTTLGGMEAVIWTDVLQAFVLLGGMLGAIVIVVVETGGIGEVVEIASAGDKLNIWRGGTSLTELATWSIMLGTLALQFGPYTTDQAVVQRYLTATDERAAARGVWLNGLLAVPFAWLFFALGTCLWVFFRSHPEMLTVGMQSDEIFPLFVARKMPVGMSGLVIAGVFAASMSSLDSSMHAISTAVTTDFYRRFRPQATDQSCLRLARFIIIVCGIIAVVVACVLATYDIRSLWFFFQRALGLLGSALVGLFMLGIFSTRANVPGVLIGSAASVAVLVWVTFFTHVHFFLYAIIGIGVAVIVGTLASLVVGSRPRDIDGLTWWTMPARRDDVK